MIWVQEITGRDQTTQARRNQGDHDRGFADVVCLWALEHFIVRDSQRYKRPLAWAVGIWG